MNEATQTAPDIMRATRRGQLRSALLALIACAALLGFQFVALPRMFALLSDTRGVLPSGAAVRELQAMFLALAVVGLACATALLHNARKILRSGQTPPDAAWLWRDTAIVRGARARRTAVIGIVTAVFTAILCVGLAAWIILTLDKLAPYALRPGATILQQKSWQQ